MRIPFTPSVYEHAARVIGRTPWETSRDPDLLFEAHREAWQLYRHVPVVVGIDIYNLEAEAYGAVVTEPGGNGIPAIHTPLIHALDETLEIPPFDPARDGRIPMVLEVGRRLKEALPDADIRIPVAGPFSVGINLRGINGLCEDAALFPEATARFLMRLAENQCRLCRAVVDAGLDVAFFESAAAPPLLSPRQFHDLELPALRQIIRLTECIVGHPVPCIMGGDTFRIIDDILSTGTGFVVCNVETDQAAFVRRVRETHPDVRIRVNMDPGIVACEDPGRIRREVNRILDLTAGYRECLMGTGCLPYETPPENLALIRRLLEE